MVWGSPRVARPPRAAARVSPRLWTARTGPPARARTARSPAGGQVSATHTGADHVGVVAPGQTSGRVFGRYTLPAPSPRRSGSARCRSYKQAKPAALATSAKEKRPDGTAAAAQPAPATGPSAAFGRHHGCRSQEVHKRCTGGRCEVHAATGRRRAISTPAIGQPVTPASRSAQT